MYIQGYTVTYNRIDHSDPYEIYPKKTVTVKHGRTEVIIDELAWYGKYEFHVKAYNSVGKSSDSVSVYVNLNEKQSKYKPPGAIEFIRAATIIHFNDHILLSFYFV